MSTDGFFSTTTTTIARYAMIGDNIIRLDEIQSVRSQDKLINDDDLPLSLVRFRNKEEMTVEATPEDIFELIGQKI